MDDPQESTAVTVVEEWARRIASLDPAAVVSLYHPQAQLWGTLAGHLRIDADGLRSYFDRFLDRHAVDPEINQVHVRTAGETLLVAGDYTFRLQDTADAEAVSRRARYTMVLGRHRGEWCILQHHSSGWIEDGI